MAWEGPAKKKNADDAPPRRPRAAPRGPLILFPRGSCAPRRPQGRLLISGWRRPPWFRRSAPGDDVWGRRRRFCGGCSAASRGTAARRRWPATRAEQELLFAARRARLGSVWQPFALLVLRTRHRGRPAPSDPHGPTGVARRPVWRCSRAAVIPADGAICLLVSYSR